MSPLLQQVLKEIEQLTLEEQQQVINYVGHQLQNQVTQPKDTLVPESSVEKRARAKEILASTCGSWGNKSLDEIDAELDRQRREDWGE